MQAQVNSLLEMQELGEQLSAEFIPGQHWHFNGPLGAGKTTLIQSIFAAMGVSEPVLSPTFSVFEPHTTGKGAQLLHIDLYRIESPDELIHTGLDFYEHSDCSWFIEWPCRGGSMIPQPDVNVTIEYDRSNRKVTVQKLNIGDDG